MGYLAAESGYNSVIGRGVFPFRPAIWRWSGILSYFTQELNRGVPWVMGGQMTLARLLIGGGF